MKYFVSRHTIRFVLKCTVAFIFCISFLLTSCRKDKPSDIQSDFFVKFFGVSGVNYGVDVCQSSDGGYLALGSSILPGKGMDIMLVKTDKFGNEEWTRSFGDSLDDFAKSLRITSDGGIIILGTTTSQGPISLQTDVYFIKTNNMGFVSWTQKFGSDSTDQEGNCVQQTSDGDFIIVGSTNDASPANQNPEGVKDILLIKTYPDGNFRWSQTRGGKKDDVGNYIQQKPNGGYVIIGSTESFSESGQDKSNIIIVETNDNGVQTNMFSYGFMNNDFGECIQILPDNTYIISGTCETPENTFEMYVAKLPVGNIREPVWTKKFELSSLTNCKYIEGTDDNGLILTGTSSKQGSKDICLIKLISDGSISFTKYFGETAGEENGNVVKQTVDGGFILVGTNAFDGPSMMNMIKVNASGEQK